MKRFIFFAIVFLFMVGIFSVNAQDLIILKDGNIIEAKITEISQIEIKYKRFNHLDGPIIVIPKINILSIRYENGSSEIINAIANTNSINLHSKRHSNKAMNQDKFIFGINANAGGALGYIWEGATGTGINFEFGKGNFNSEINLIFPTFGFGFLATFNGFWPSQIGGFYLGGGAGFLYFGIYISEKNVYMFSSVPLGINIGYKFVTKSGIYFRTGTFAAFDFGFIWEDVLPFFIKPDLAIGWTMR